MRKTFLASAMLAILALAAAALHSVPARAESASRPLKTSDLSQLLPWVSSKSIDKVTPEGLLASVEKAVAASLKVAAPPTTGHFNDDLASFQKWLKEKAPDLKVRGELLRDGVQKALAGLHEDGTALFPPNKYMVPPEVEGYDKGGVGLLVDQQPDAKGSFVIFETLDGFPGAAIGLRAGDRLVAVGDHPLKGLSYREMADLVRGNLGTKVKLVVERPGGDKQMTFEVERVWLNPNPKNISSKVLPGGVGYVRVKYLGERMDLELVRVLDKFKADGVKKIVLDLRNNEGLMAGSQDVGAVFLGDNIEITKLVSRGGSEVRRTHGQKSCDLPLIVLVNRYTSGAGLLLAAALRDQCHARLVGEATVWRDQPTESMELPDGSTVTVTTGYYVLAGGQSLRSRDQGLKPEAVVEQDPLKAFGGDDDAQLKRAVQMHQ